MEKELLEMLKEMQKSIINLDNKMDTRISELDNKMDTRISELDTRISELDSKMDTGFSKLDTRISELDNKMDTRISKLEKGIDFIKVHVVSTTENVAEIKTELGILSTRMSNLESNSKSDYLFLFNKVNQLERMFFDFSTK